jgi:diguanylate cyclase (GGDEF)-like protein
VNNLQQRIKNNWLMLLFVISIGFTVISGFEYMRSNTSLQATTEHFHDFLISERKAKVKTEVENRVKEIQFENDNITDASNQIVKEKVMNVVSSLLELDSDTSHSSLELFDHLTHSNTDDLYFAINSKGDLIHSGSDPSLSGLNIYDTQDSNGTYFIQEMLKAVETPEGVYVSYEWPKETGGAPQLKTSYCYYIREMDLLVGLGYYEEDKVKELQDEIFERLQKYYEERLDYVFIIDFNGIARVFPTEEMIGMSTLEIRTDDGIPLHEKLLNQVQDEAGFVNYKYFIRGTDQKSEKTTYVRAVQEWDVYIGMGFYHDDIIKAMDAYQGPIQEDINKRLIITILGFFLIGSTVLILTLRGQRLQNALMKQEDLIFEELFQLSNEGIIILSSEGEIAYVNRIIREYYTNSLDEYIVDGHLSLELIEDNIYSFENDYGKVNYVEYKSEMINYKNKTNTIYFIKDVTDQHLEAKRLKKQAYLDELTHLPNRRQLVDDFEEYCYQSLSAPKVLAMIDLDHFKVINDTYGHDRGDQVLILLKDVFQNRLRKEDVFYRYGGEEFVLSLHDVNLKEAKDIIEDIKELFIKQSKDIYGYDMSFSAGLVYLEGQDIPSALSEYLKQADLNLYKAKELGRNQIIY